MLYNSVKDRAYGAKGSAVALHITWAVEIYIFA